jgi:hypothetical protein
MRDIQQNTIGRRSMAGAAVVTSVDPDELIPHDEAAELLRVRPQTLAAWRMEKQGPRWIKCGRRVFYRRVDIGAWLAAQFCGGDAA